MQKTIILFLLSLMTFSCGTHEEIPLYDDQLDRELLTSLAEDKCRNSKVFENLDKGNNFANAGYTSNIFRFTVSTRVQGGNPTVSKYVFKILNIENGVMTIGWRGNKGFGFKTFNFNQEHSSRILKAIENGICVKDSDGETYFASDTESSDESLNYRRIQQDNHAAPEGKEYYKRVTKNRLLEFSNNADPNRRIPYIFLNFTGSSKDIIKHKDGTDTKDISYQRDIITQEQCNDDLGNDCDFSNPGSATGCNFEINDNAYESYATSSDIIEFDENCIEGNSIQNLVPDQNNP